MTELFDPEYYAACVKNLQLKQMAEKLSIPYKAQKEGRRIALVGDTSKTCERLLTRYIDGTYFEEDACNFTFDFKSKTIQMNQKMIQAVFSITHDFPMKNLVSYFDQTDAVGIVVDSHQSRYENQRLIKKYLDSIPSDKKLIILLETSTKSCITTKEDVQAVLNAENRPDISIRITSAKEDLGVTEAFNSLIMDKNFLKARTLNALSQENIHIEEKVAQLPQKYVRMVLIGDASQTKENLLMRYAHNAFFETNTPTLDYAVKEEKLDGKTIQSKIWLLQDPRFLCMEKHIGDAAAIGIVINSNQTKQSSQVLIDKYLRFVGDRKIVVFYEQADAALNTTQADIFEILKMADRADISVLAISVKDNKGIVEGFRYLAQQCLNDPTSKILEDLNTIINDCEPMVIAKLCQLKVPIEYLNASDNKAWLLTQQKDQQAEIKNTVNQYRFLQELKYLLSDPHKSRSQCESQCVEFIRLKKNWLLKQNLLERIWDWACSFFQKKESYLMQFSDECQSFFCQKPRIENQLSLQTNVLRN